MAENEERQSKPSSTTAQPHRPTIMLPPRPAFAETIFNNGPGTATGLGLGFSPGPMTLVSNFFADSDDCKSFSQLLAGAMASPAAGHLRPNFMDQQSQSLVERSSDGVAVSDGDFRFKQSRPAGLSVHQQQQQSIFSVPPGLSPATLLDSPGLGMLSPAQVAAKFNYFELCHQFI